MKIFILQVAILLVILFSTNSLSAQEKDTLKKNEIGVLSSGGTQDNFKGLFFSGGCYLIHKRIQFTFQYSLYGYNYVKLKDANYNWYLENANSISTLIGYNIPIHKFTVSINGGLNIGIGRFLLNSNPYSSFSALYINYNNNEFPSYLPTNFFGYILNYGFKYKLSNKISAVLSGTSFGNYYFQNNPYYLDNNTSHYKFKFLGQYHGIQLGINYKLK